MTNFPLDLESQPVVIPVLAGEGKTSALLEARETWAGRTVWTTARNRLIATETGRAAGAGDANALSTAMLREQIAKGQGPTAGDVLVVDEVDLLAREDVELILDLAKLGVIVDALGDLKQSGE